MDDILPAYTALLQRDAPEQEPQVHVLAARALLQAHLSHLPALGADAAADDERGICSGALGANLLQCEETAASERALTACVARALSRTDAAAAGLPLRALLQLSTAGLEASSQLALLYAGWSRPGDALRRLSQGRTLHAAAARGVARAASASSPPPPRLVDLAALDAAHTQALFLAAQVHGQLGQPERAQACVEATLSRQLAELVLVSAEPGAPPLFAVDRIEWVRNALRLAELHARRCQWVAAAHSLAAAEVVLAGASPGCSSSGGGGGAGARWSLAALAARGCPDAVQRLHAEAALHWARLYLEVLRAARDRSLAASGEAEDAVDWAPPSLAAASAGGGDDSDSALGADSLQLLTALALPDRLPQSFDGGGPFAAFLRAAGAAGSGSASVGGGGGCCSYGPLFLTSFADAAAAGAAPAFPGTCLSGLARVPTPAATAAYADARALFKALHAASARALQYFALDGFVSEHVEAVAAQARAYRALRHWEADARRAAAMLQRSLALLEPLLRELAPAVFIHLHKELALELACAAEDAAELQPTPAAHARALGLYEHFFACYAEPRLDALHRAAADAGEDAAPLPVAAAAAPLPGATPLDAASVEAFLSAQLSAARLLARRDGGSAAAVAASLRRYRWLSEAAREGGVLVPAGGAGDTLRRLHALCVEMAALLPEKLRRARAHEAAAAARA